MTYAVLIFLLLIAMFLPLLLQESRPPRYCVKVEGGWRCSADRESVQECMERAKDGETVWIGGSAAW
jgi:hypothetical protein